LEHRKKDIQRQRAGAEEAVYESFYLVFLEGSLFGLRKKSSGISDRRGWGELSRYHLLEYLNQDKTGTFSWVCPFMTGPVRKSGNREGKLERGGEQQGTSYAQGKKAERTDLRGRSPSKE